YYGLSNGTFRVRSFDGSSLGSESTIDLHGLTNTHFPLANVTGMFLDQGRLYYTVAGNSNLFYRYFSPSWDMTGAQTFTVNGSAEFDWGSVAGMTMVDGNIYVGRTNGNLDRIGFSNRLPVVGSRTTVSGPGIDGRNWRSRGLFVF
ncbi:MAG: PKD domain containing protein, partial [Myxococcota bacterium]